MDNLKFREIYYLLLHADETPQSAYESAEKLLTSLVSIASKVVQEAKPTSWLSTNIFLKYKVSDDGSDASGVSDSFSNSFNAEAFMKKMTVRHKMIEAFLLSQSLVSKTREDFIADCLAVTPMFLIDGAWLRGVAFKPGRLREDEAMLVETWEDEVGNHNYLQHHALIWEKLLKSCGAWKGEWENDAEFRESVVFSKSFVFDSCFADDSFAHGAVQLALSLLNRQFYPEVLGYNLYFENNFALSEASSRAARYFGIDQTYHQLHASIDNPSQGHGLLAVKAIASYLALFGDEETRHEQYMRVWRGFVIGLKLPWGTSFKKKSPDITEMERAVAKVFDGKLETATLYPYHQGSTLEGVPLLQWFQRAEPGQLVRSLGRSPFVVPGHPEKSKLITVLMSFRGGMYNVFSKEEQDLLKRWILELPKQEGK